MFDWLLWLLALLGAGTGPHAPTDSKDYVGVVAAEAAYASFLPKAAPVNPAPVDPKNCPTCGGTGRVRTGDGLGWTKCPTCQPGTNGEKTPANNPQLPVTTPPKQGWPPRNASPAVGHCPGGQCPVSAYQSYRA
jgi:hypothetical protein